MFDIGAWFAGLIRRLLDWFLGLAIFNKLIVINFSVAFLAIVMPVAKYYIFESWFVINNPVAVYLIGIVFVMIATIYLPNLYGYIIRMVLNFWYLAWILFLLASGGISHAPYELTTGFYFNIAAPVLFMVFSSLQFFLKER